MNKQRFTRPLRRTLIAIALPAGALAGASAWAGGIMLYEIGTADVGLASAGYGARAQDASTVFTNPAGMTRLEGRQFLVGGQVLYSNTEFSIDSGTSPQLGSNDGGKAIGSNGWFPGGGIFTTFSVSPDLKLGFAVSGTFGAAVDYDDNWVGRYYGREALLVGVSFLPSIAYKATDKLSIGASINAMYGKMKQEVAINNVDPNFGDGKLKIDDDTWATGVNLGLMYEVNDRTRLGFTWSSQVDLDFKSDAQFSGLAPGLNALLANRGLLNSKIKVNIKVPQQAMGSAFLQLNDRWALLGSVGWQEWSKFGQVELGIEDSNNPQQTTTDLDFDDTWHGAIGAQYHISEPWTLNFGVAYDSDFQSGDVSPLLPVNGGWRFGVGGERTLSKTSRWGLAAEVATSDTLNVSKTSTLPPAAGGRGNLDGSYDNPTNVFLSLYYTASF